MALIPNKTLETLELISASIGDDNCEFLAKILRRNESIKTLSLCNNGITDHGVASLATALKDNTTLCRLDLSENLIRRVGAAGSLIHSLSWRTVPMESLDLTGLFVKYGTEGPISSLAASLVKHAVVDAEWSYGQKVERPGSLRRCNAIGGMTEAFLTEWMCDVPGIMEEDTYLNVKLVCDSGMFVTFSWTTLSKATKMVQWGARIYIVLKDASHSIFFCIGQPNLDELPVWG
ncbi:Aste57867_21490 [Aphanomyces stellatus]|uniref:Aste57867_21490 protein n=1 Tax=Aphanomyces stellatus TaxID=120398 RepID=A0A485LIC3_9STRA|nr:hypothetical protein As57867_021421 [Aphanomyces stellatus]VFT98160.1 Aste57867_21490 [Aphanomyces stellatus]